MDPENLRAVPLFASMADEDLRKIATFANEDSAPEGATLVREGDFSNDMVAIESGTADVMRGGETVGSLGPGDVFGEIGVLGKEARTATIVATSSMRLVRLDSWNVKRLPPEVREQMAQLVETRRAKD
jgi:CRP/FNR family transcriptional regulator, cyclic AMP receptor protein